MGSDAAKQPCWEAKGGCFMKGCAMAGTGVGFKDDQEQMMEETPLVGGCLAGGWPQGLLFI